MSRILCWFGRHRWTVFLDIRQELAAVCCSRCLKELKP